MSLECAIAAVFLLIITAVASAQTFNSGSDGTDGALTIAGSPGTVVMFDPSQYHGSQVAANIFNFTTITVQAGVTVKLSADKINGPVYWLASGNVDIEGAIDLSGGNGPTDTVNPFQRVQSVPGAGGYAGGVGGNSTQPALGGNGPGGGAPGVTNLGCCVPFEGSGGAFSGNQFLIPLVGGSGGGGGMYTTFFGSGGGAGGGALLIASSTQIVVNGIISAKGGAGGPGSLVSFDVGGGGSGGAIRLVANTIAGSGTVSVVGGTSPGNAGGSGRIRVEAYNIAFSGGLQGPVAQASPFPLLLPTTGPSSAMVVSIGGVSITPNASTFPDITINTTSPVDVVIQTQNVPTTAAIKVTILDENGVADTVIQAPPLGNCTGNVCTTTVPVVFPFGASRGLTKVTWTQ